MIWTLVEDESLILRCCYAHQRTLLLDHYLARLLHPDFTDDFGWELHIYGEISLSMVFYDLHM